MRKNLLVFMSLFCAVTISAREYQHSVGIIAGNSFGLSYKGYVRSQEHLVIEANLMTQLIAPGQYTIGAGISADGGANSPRISDAAEGRISAGTNNFLSFEANPNVYYQAQVANLSEAVLNWYIGGGIGVGALWFAFDNFQTITGFPRYFLDPTIEGDPAFKVDEHAVFGVEFCFKKVPLNLSVDFRPGCGESFSVYSGSVGQATAAAVFSAVYFDWTAGVALRYRIGQ